MDLIEYLVQFLSCLNNSVSVVAVHNKDQTLSVLEVVLPQGTKLKTNKKYLRSTATQDTQQSDRESSELEIVPCLDPQHPTL